MEAEALISSTLSLLVDMVLHSCIVRGSSFFLSMGNPFDYVTAKKVGIHNERKRGFMTLVLIFFEVSQMNRIIRYKRSGNGKEVLLV